MRPIFLIYLFFRNTNGDRCSFKTSYLAKKKPVIFFQDKNNKIPINNNNYIKENITYNSSNKKTHNLEKFDPYPLNYKFFK